MELSKRLQAVADLLDFHERVADIGCDHGFVSIYLIENRKASHCLAMDVNKGPLERAKEHVYEKQLSTYIETRLSDGAKEIRFLEEKNEGQRLEVEAALMAGMGGRLMIQIIQDSLEKFLKLEEFVLQPQSEIAKVRRFIRETGWHIEKENMIYEDGKFYPMMKVVPGKQEDIRLEKLPDSLRKEVEKGNVTLPQLQQVWDEYGEKLLKSKNPILLQYLKNEEKIQSDILHNLKLVDTVKSRLRKKEIEEKIKNISRGLEWFLDEM